MKKSLFFFVFVITLSFSAKCQTTVFFDDFEGTTAGVLATDSGQTFTTNNVSYPANYTYTEMGVTTNQASITLANNNKYLILGSNNTNTTVSLGATYSLSNYGNGFNATLSANPGLVTWTFNMRKSGAVTSSYNSSSAGRWPATVLVASRTDLSAAGTVGYMIAQATSTTYALYKFSNGVNSNIPTDYVQIGAATAALASQTNYGSFMVTYNPSGNKWTLSSRDDGSTGFTDPTGGAALTQAFTDTVVEAEFTGIPMAAQGYYFRKTASNSNNMSFDNFKVTVAGSLPVTMGDVWLKKANNTVEISWRVYNELNVSKYMVERSNDGFTYHNVGTVIAAGKSVYNFTDFDPTIGKNFYRLRSIDRDNSNSLSKSHLIDFKTLVKALTVSPNPTNNGTFTLSLTNFNAGKVVVSLYSMTGQLVMNVSISNSGTVTNKIIQLPAVVVKGNYRLIATDGSKSESTSLIVR